MSTHAFQTVVATESSDLHRKRLRTAVLVTFFIRLVYELHYKSIDLIIRYGPDRRAVLTWALGFAPFVALYLIMWRRLSSSRSRLPIGIAMGLGLSEALRLLYPVWSRAGVPAMVNFLSPQLLVAAVYLILMALAIRTFASLKDGQTEVALGIPIGLYFSSVVQLWLLNGAIPFGATLLTPHFIK
jgi:hypothetical protein